MSESERADRPRTSPGPKPETFKVEGVDWEEAVRRSFQVKKPPEGWPDTVKKPRKPKAPGQ